MSEIILDYSANTFRNDKALIKRAIDEIKAVDTGKHSIVFKTQLFANCPPNTPCTHESFEYMYEYGNSQGYKVTSSVFDKESLDYLLKFDVPFIKIANRPDLYWLLHETPRKIRIYVSTDKQSAVNRPINLGHDEYNTEILYCISKYPALIEDYENQFNLHFLGKTYKKSISDHTIGLDLYKKHEPKIWEKHLRLSDSTGLDAGSFAITPQELSEIL